MARKSPLELPSEAFIWQLIRVSVNKENFDQLEGHNASVSISLSLPLRASAAHDRRRRSHRAYGRGIVGSAWRQSSGRDRQVGCHRRHRSQGEFVAVDSAEY